MTLDFDRMPSLVQPRFKGGQGEAETRIFQDDMGKILRLTLQPGSSIGLHTHEDSCEIMYFLSGTGVCLDDGADTADFRRLLEELRYREAMRRVAKTCCVWLGGAAFVLAVIAGYAEMTDACVATGAIALGLTTYGIL